MAVMRFMTMAFAVLACTYTPSDVASLLPNESLQLALDVASEMRVAADAQKQVLLITDPGSDCRRSTAPQVAVTQQPAKGFVTFEPVPETLRDMHADEYCLSWGASGIGVVYNAGTGTAGPDTFEISALRADGGVATHAVYVLIGD